MTLLSKTRTLNRLLQKTAGNPVDFKEMAELLRDTIGSNIYVISRKGKILGHAAAHPIVPNDLSKMVQVDGRILEEYNDHLLTIRETTKLTTDSNAYNQQIHQLFEHPYVTIVPVIGGGSRLGTLVLSRENQSFVDDDLILAEYGSTIVGMEILRIRAEEAEDEARSKAAVQVAVGSLSFSELEAVDHIFEELNGTEGLLVASKIADRAGITRSVIVNAMRKLESAGVVETRSLGMKGTYIKILNDQLFQQIEKAKV